MATLMFLDQFNNYFNRIVKKYQTVSDYGINSSHSKMINNYNFKPNDNVNTELIINWSESWQPDYLVVIDNIIDNNITQYVIKSRWFVMEADRTREGQYHITVKRDTVADFKTEILAAPTFIEKATLSADDPLIYNSEGMSFNQIKKSETLLKDETGMAWVVGYCVQDRTRHPESGYFEGTSKIKTITNVTNVPSWIRNSFGTTKKFITELDNNAPLYAKFQVKTNPAMLGINVYGLARFDNIYDTSASSGLDAYAINTIDDWGTAVNMNIPSITFGQAIEFTFNTDKAVNWAIETATPITNDMANSFSHISSAYRTSIMSALRTDLNIETYARYQELMRYSGVVYKDGSKYYRLHIENRGTNTETKDYQFSSSSNAVRYFTIGLSYNSNPNAETGSYTYVGSTSDTRHGFTLGTSAISLYIWREELYSGYVENEQSIFEDATIKAYIPATRNHILSQPYDMFCIPYGELNCGTFTTNKDVSLLAARILAKSGIGASNAYIYDVQLLPYCPVRDFVRSNNISIATLTRDVDYTLITDQYDNNLSIIFWGNACDFSFNINTSFEIPRNANNTYAEDLKISSECDLYRLSSPNYNGAFDFKVALNDGYVDYFNVDCSYKPFNPYIHINPNFHGLYGQDFDDARGLICNGDFSIAIMTDQWAQYELQNKNYQQIFNTKIQTLDSFAELRRTNLYIDTINDVFNNNAAATFRGATSGGVPGAIVAAAQTTVNSGVKLGKGLYDINESNRIIKNQLNNNFLYQLGNIKALPASISKTTSFTKNNKLFPFVEYYSCTDEEKTLLKDKLKYDGMTVMRIDKIMNYISNTRRFVKGQIIRLEGISDDTHILNDIYTEIKKGVYL